MRSILIRIINIFLKATGILAMVLFVLSLTDVPYNAYHWLGTSNSMIKKTPDTIIILGGAGMPSQDGFIRCYYAAETAIKFNKAEIIIALPTDDNNSTWQLNMMANELIIRGVDSSRISYETEGFNTHSQAENIAKFLGNQKQERSIAIITSPEHMYRAVMSFKQEGYLFVGGIPTFEKPIDENKIKDKNKSKDKRIKSLELRYNIWSYLNYELLVSKEFFAISYYKIKGWI